MLYGWMKSLIIYLILSGIVMNMLPGKNYKSYINSFMGLIMLIILAEPLAYIFHISSGDISGFANELERYIDDGGETVSYDSIYNYYEMSLAESMRYDMVQKGYEADKLEVITDAQNKILRCTVYLEEYADKTDVVKDEMKNYISEVYNVDVNNIYIVRR